MFTTAIVLGLLLFGTQLPSVTVCDDVSVPPGDLAQGQLGHQFDDFLVGMTEKGFSGAVLVSRRGEVLLKKGYGYANREAHESNSSETLFNIASVSKIFTAAAILDLDERRKLSLDDRLSEYLGPFPTPKSTATIHHLLTHTAGLVVRGAELQYQTRDAFVASVKNAPVEAVPGEEFRYTNAGYTLLAAIVEVVSGMPFENFLDERFFEPACMRHTAFVWDDRNRTLPVATGYAGKTVEQLSPRPPESDVWGNRGPSDIATNVGDLYRWILAVQDRKILSKASIEKMFTAYVGDEGYGWHVVDTEFGRLLRRGGGLPEFESSLRWYIDEDLVIVVLINNHIGFRLPVVQGLEKIAFGRAEIVQ